MRAADEEVGSAVATRAATRAAIRSYGEDCERAKERRSARRRLHSECPAHAERRAGHIRRTRGTSRLKKN